MGMRREELNGGFRVAGKAVRPLQGRIEGSSQQVRLEPRVMDLLVYLAELRGQVVTRDAIIRDVWRGISVSDDVISRSIYLIRKALNDGNESPTPPTIETIPKRGYRLVADVTPLPIEASASAAAAPAILPSATPAAPATASSPVTEIPARRRFPLVPWVSAAGVLLCVFLLGAVWISRTDPQSIQQPAAIVSGNPQLVRQEPTAIVVLPFLSAGEASQTPYIGSGLTDSVVTGLGALQDLRVIGGFSANRALASHEGYADIGRDLQVSTVLEGSVETHGDNITL